MRIQTKFLFIVIVIIGFNSCTLVSVFIMAKEEKITVATWEDEKYKVRVQSRRGWAGPRYYHCKVKEKKIGGLYYKTIIIKTFSRETYNLCRINYPLKSDTLIIDICNKKTSLKK